MSQPLINLILPLVTQELENIYLSDRAVSSYIAQTDRWQEDLQDYVLKRVPACYVRVEDRSDYLPLNLIPRSLHQQVRSIILEWMQQVATRREQISAPLPHRKAHSLVA